jgi:hypothetical protein
MLDLWAARDEQPICATSTILASQEQLAIIVLKRGWFLTRGLHVFLLARKVILKECLSVTKIQCRHY